MLVNSVIIVLREVLEAALMIGVLLALSQRMQLGRKWLFAALAVGLAGAVVYARLLGPVSDLFDGAGQELVNAGMQYCVAVALIVVVFNVARFRAHAPTRSTLLPVAMAIAIASSTTQEGSEIIVFMSGFLQVHEFMSSVTIGSITGAGIGFSIGVLFYYLLLAQPPRRVVGISVLLLGLTAASMSIQGTNQLVQADWLAAAMPIWDTSGLIGEDSLPGQVLYALVGYEATPSPVEAGLYLGALIAVALAALAGRYLGAGADGSAE